MCRKYTKSRIHNIMSLEIISAITGTVPQGGGVIHHLNILRYITVNMYGGVPLLTLHFKHCTKNNSFGLIHFNNNVNEHGGTDKEY